MKSISDSDRDASCPDGELLIFSKSGTDVESSGTLGKIGSEVIGSSTSRSTS